MSIKLPEALEKYIHNSDNKALDEALAAFTPDATVVDEGENTTAVGKDSIRAWMADYTSKYTTTTEVKDMAEKDGEAVVTVLVSGDFPGNRAEFVYRCTLRDGLISRLVTEFAGFR
jgi:ketosteroid isomerase-like protein